MKSTIVCWKWSGREGEGEGEDEIEVEMDWELQLNKNGIGNGKRLRELEKSSFRFAWLASKLLKAALKTWRVSRTAPKVALMPVLTYPRNVELSQFCCSVEHLTVSVGQITHWQLSSSPVLGRSSLFPIYLTSCSIPFRVQVSTIVWASSWGNASDFYVHHSSLPSFLRSFERVQHSKGWRFHQWAIGNSNSQQLRVEWPIRRIIGSGVQVMLRRWIRWAIQWSAAIISVEYEFAPDFFGL